MYANSRQIDSPQTGPHEDIERRVRRAMAHPLRKPVAEHTREAFLQAQQWLSAQGRPLWLDSGCGSDTLTVPQPPCIYGYEGEGAE